VSSDGAMGAMGAMRLFLCEEENDSCESKFDLEGLIRVGITRHIRALPIRRSISFLRFDLPVSHSYKVVSVIL